jgi:hypothetical protein
VGRKTGSTFSSQIVLGEKYRDTVSGYEGTATAVYFFLHACERVLLEQWNSANAELKELSFDAPRLVHVETKKEITSPRTGGFQPDPPPRGQANR